MSGKAAAPSAPDISFGVYGVRIGLFSAHMRGQLAGEKFKSAG